MDSDWFLQYLYCPRSDGQCRR